MNDLFDGVIYAGIDTDKHKYPIGKFLFNLFHFLMHFNPIQDGGQEGGGGKSRPPHQFFPCNFYKRRTLPPKRLDF